MSTPENQTILARRRRLLSPTYRLFYEEPVHLVRAEGVWMYDAQGRRYLDAYNNVPVVGHCHPHVVERMTQQARTLNTHTRYITDQPLELAERLLATMPAEIGNVTFTCTGSDANDLAARICKASTGGTGFIITDFAYHGTTETIAGMSPSGGAPLGPSVYTVQAPIDAGGPADFGNRVRLCIGKMRRDGIKPAALLVDTILSSDGVVSHPAGFLADGVKAIREAGGLFIADEVQPGFGRTGDAMWGFQRHGVVPDLVTMGKPMGNGHPVAAVAARPEVLEAFAKLTRYFNTFGGNSVSCATALAVLDVIEREKLIDNARETGAYLQQGLRRLGERHDRIGEVRGAGLFLGVDIGPNREHGLDARQETARIVNGLRHEGVLIGSAGRGGNALKIRPPLPIRRAEVDYLLEKLDTVMARPPA
jgi:4-aminobutyrate aminotransferase-like enzyme